MISPELTALNLLAEIYPHYFSSFYTRGKLINGRIPAAPATLIIDLIKQCSFGCAFCFAGDTRNRGRMFSPEQLRDLLDRLTGIPRIVLIGGEPFEHPRLGEVLEIVCAVAAQEVEIFTNGAAVPLAAKAADAWLKKLLKFAPGNKLTLTLAADACHKAIHGEKRFEALIENFIRWGAQGLHTRFNVSHARIYTGDYLDLPTMRAVMAELSPVLLREMESALLSDRLTDKFYLNPLVAQGRQNSAEAGVEFLRPADMLFSPELVLTLNRDNKPEYRAALNAAWMDDPPDCLVLGEAAPDILPLLAERVAAPRMGADDVTAWPVRFFKAAATGRKLQPEFPAPDDIFYGEMLDDAHAALFAARTIYTDFDLLCRNRSEYFARLAERLWRVVEKPQPFIWELSGYYNIDRVGLPVLHLLLQKAAGAGRIDEHFYAHMLKLWQPYIAGGDNPPQPAAFFERRNLGRLPDERGGFIALDRVALHSGFGDWPLPGDYVLKPQVLMLPGGALQCGFDARIEWLPGDGSQEAAARLLEFYALLLPPAIHAEFRRRLLMACSPGSPQASLLQSSAIGNPFEANADYFFSDPETLFNYAAFDRNSNSLPYDNMALLQRLLQYDLTDYPAERAEAWRDKLRFHLRRGSNECEIDLSRPAAVEDVERAALQHGAIIKFSGAELADHVELGDILRRMVARGLKFSIESDGAVFARRSIAERMSRFGLQRAELRIYGGTRFAHQLVKGRDDLYSVLAGARNLVECGVETSLRLKVTDYNRGTLKLAAVEALKCGLKPDEALLFEDEPAARFATEIAEARAYARLLSGKAAPGERPPLSQGFKPQGVTHNLDLRYCRFKSRHDAANGEAPAPESLLLRRAPGSYEQYGLNTSAERRDIVYFKNMRRMVFIETGGVRRRLNMEPECIACRHLTRCAAAFSFDDDIQHESAPALFSDAHERLDTSAPGADVAGVFARLEPGASIAVTGRYRHFVIDADDDPARSGPELGEICDLAYACGLKLLDYKLPGWNDSERFALLYEKPPQAPPRIERMAVANISSACIANCIMCSMPQVFKGHTIGGADACALFEELKICGFELVDIFGGEISLRSDLLTLIACVKRLNMISNMISTGYNLTEDYVRGLVEAGLDKVEISLDSPDAPLHDEIRRCEGLFEHACRAAANFRAAGKVLLEINTVILPHNCDQLRRLHRLVVQTLGIRHHRLFYCVQIPTALTGAHNLSLQQARRYFEEEYPGLLKLAAEFGSVIDFCPPVNPDDYADKEAFYAEVSAGRYLKHSRCEAPQRDLFITPEGDIYPCVNPPIINRIEPLGHMGRDRIIDALSSQAMRRAAEEAGMWPECASCICKR